MRKAQQLKIFELLQTLREAHDELRKRHEPAVIQNLLADCQEFALKIGQFIESIESEGTKTVFLLEKYCEIVYKASLNSDVKRHIKGIQTQLVMIENSVRAELRPSRIEIAFLPYQQSMWDSLESIYLAAKADPNCDAYCVPIPWFEKLPDGAFGKMHYDGDRYPANIEVTDWRSYNIEARRPDIIFIHSPYDEGNYVTSVHPYFYSKRLRDYTGLLCYVPYFVCADNVEEHFCTTAGCIYAHKTILESEKARDTYVRVFEAAFGSRFGDPRDKFVALGSPKYDKALTTRREDCELPDAWEKLITKTDGSKKKVVLYNTSLSGILKYDEQYLVKIRSVLEAFKGRDDVALWWRPHPLSEQTYGSMRITLAEEYKMTIDNFKSKSGNLYDDTPDLHRAIARSDVYYGDNNSSIVPLYETTGNKCFISGLFPGSEKYVGDSEFFFMTMFEYENELYSNILDRNLILRTNLSSLQTVYFSKVPDHGFLEKKLYHHSSVIGDKAIFVPYCNDDIAILDLHSNEYTICKLSLEKKYVLNGEGNFFNVCMFGKKVFLIPFAYRAIATYDLDTQKCEHCLDLTELFPTEEDDLMFHQYEYLNDATILLPALRSNKILEFHLDTFDYLDFDGKNGFLV
jgi:hypothetical protein